MGRIRQYRALRPLPPIILHRCLVSPLLSTTSLPTTTNILNSDYSAKVFGFATFGKVYGLIICLAGLLNFSQSALDAATHKTFKNDPVPINVILLSLALLVGLALVAFVWRKSHRIQRENIEEEAEEARETLMPGTSESVVNGYGSIHGSGSGTVSPSEENRGRRL
jgi:multisubunit Na+/H+ antiporter MnhC subunit